MMNEIMQKFEVDENVVCSVYTAKLNKLIQADKFKLEKEFIIELEEISN